MRSAGRRKPRNLRRKDPSKRDGMSVSSSAAESLAGTPESSLPPSPGRKHADTELQDVRAVGGKLSTDGDGGVSSTETGVGPASETRPQGVIEEDQEDTTATGEAGAEDTGVGLGLQAAPKYRELTEEERQAKLEKNIEEARAEVEGRRRLKEDQDKARAQVDKRRRRKERREKKGMAEEGGGSDSAEDRVGPTNADHDAAGADAGGAGAGGAGAVAGSDGSSSATDDSVEESSSQDDNPFELCYSPSSQRDADRADSAHNAHDAHKPDFRGHGGTGDDFGAGSGGGGYQNDDGGSYDSYQDEGRVRIGERHPTGHRMGGGNILYDWGPDATVQGGVASIASCWSGIMSNLCGSETPWMNFPMVGIFAYDPVPDNDDTII